MIQASISKTSFLQFETNRYSVPSIYSEMPCEILASPDHIEIVAEGKKIASHQRSFERRQKIEDPTHRESLLQKSPNFKLHRIYELLKRMDSIVNDFLKGADSEGEDPLGVSYELFKMLRSVSRAVLLSALREAKALGIYRISFIQSLLRIAEPQKENPVYPQDQRLLEINYEGRKLEEYDELI